MQAAEVKSLLEEKLPNTQVEVEGEGCNFQLNLISDELAALSHERAAKAQKDGSIAPQRKLANEKPKGETIDYDTLIKSWPATPPKRASLQ